MNYIKKPINLNYSTIQYPYLYRYSGNYYLMLLIPIVNLAIFL